MSEQLKISEQLRKKIEAMSKVPRAYAHHPQTEVNVNAKSFQRNRKWVSQPNVVPGVVDTTRALLDDIAGRFRKVDYIALAIDGDFHAHSWDHHKLSPIVLSEFARAQDHITWSLDSLAFLEEKLIDLPGDYDWLRHAWNREKITDARILSELTHDMLRVREYNIYWLLLFIFLNSTKSASAQFFIKAFVAQEGVFGAAFLHAIHSSIEFGLHFTHKSPTFRLTQMTEHWCIPLGSEIVGAFYDHILCEKCAKKGYSKEDWDTPTGGPKNTHAAAYAVAFVPEGVYYNVYESAVRNVFLEPRCSCKFVLKPKEPEPAAESSSEIVSTESEIQE